MSIPGYGRLTPLQCSMLELGGEPLDLFSQSVSDEDRKNAMRRGRRDLLSRTARDFGYDLVGWHEWILGSELSSEYRHPYGWGVTKRKLELLFNDERRIRLAHELRGES